MSSGLVPVVVARAVFAAMEAAVAVMVLMVSMVSMVLMVLMALLAALAAVAALAGANLLSATDLPGDTWSTVVGVSGCSSSSERIRGAFSILVGSWLDSRNDASTDSAPTDSAPTDSAPTDSAPAVGSE